MRAPRLEIHLDSNANVCIEKVERDGDKSRLIIDVAVDELKSLGPEDAAHRIGGTILNVLALWHKQAFENWKVPPALMDSEPDEFDVALRLVNLAILFKTDVHNGSIDALLRHAATDSEDARKYLEEAWPVLRDRLGRT